MRYLVVLIALAACGDDSYGTTDGPAAHPDAAPVDTASGSDAPLIDAPADGSVSDGGGGALDFTEDYEPGTMDVGDWILSTNPMAVRMIEPTGGNPGQYLYGEVGTSIPTWGTASLAYQPGVNDQFKRDSVFVGDWFSADVQHLGADIIVEQSGDWATDRAATLHLQKWDPDQETVQIDAFFSLPDLPNDTAPTGWQHYQYDFDARSTTIPTGWMCLEEDGSPCTPEDWSTLMHDVDAVGIGFWKPGFAYPSLGSWHLGIDNIHISANP
ncbi:MAG TPA: hypothetical protein VGM88_26790 [Kofleriaceae bacterium]|jgi:hypothetical protein